MLPQLGIDRILLPTNGCADKLKQAANNLDYEMAMDKLLNRNHFYLTTTVA